MNIADVIVLIILSIVVILIIRVLKSLDHLVMEIVQAVDRVVPTLIGMRSETISTKKKSRDECLGFFALY